MRRKVWPNLTDETGMADRMNTLPKFVASDSLSGPAWNNTTATRVEDELQIWVHPLFVGATELADLISRHAPQMPFQLADVRRYDSGVVILHYQPTSRKGTP
ncbi:hypothetical protein [Agromyces humatus]|uniref:Bacterial bifunctional deaminase-reductase C-terminal domain-containing protein n=1 Tax=Agromyces humatus TaxID=279573 RepID=A0ABP4X7W4_9MICO|nr:hypothetical protein [Agromyces humatus]